MTGRRPKQTVRPACEVCGAVMAGLNAGRQMRTCLSRRCIGLLRTRAPKERLAPLPDRFMAKVEPEPNTGCWLWTGTLHNGYGRFSPTTKAASAYRISYELFKGPVPAGMEIDHACRVRSCVNPDHLRAVTHTENMQNSVYCLKTHCSHGHLLDGANLVRWRAELGLRKCRHCTNASTAAYKIRKRQRLSQAGS